MTSGLLLVDKPAGASSHDAVRLARRALGERRIGHAGTLDPFATGLLVLLVGPATRALPYLDGEPKVYAARIRFGHETDTDDVTGVPTGSAPLPALTTDVLEPALHAFVGALDQVPPAYSAKQVAGKRAYALARRGTAPVLAPARVTVHEWRLAGIDGASIDTIVTCSGGTYVRALARDLGRALGAAAHCEALRRLRSGPFDVRDAVGFDALEAGEGRVRSMLDGLPSLATERVSTDGAARIAHGGGVPATVPGSRAALVDDDGRVLAIAERIEESWQPRVVFAGE
ncbi:MAG TPA: tRNA pseudouridine(55) synthase TruB [Gemmatimonadaceae bacterium]|nr:tRNA pseudouridine(55) synthase TruB [Gemmatimonadaceae bacterium]